MQVRAFLLLAAAAALVPAMAGCSSLTKPDEIAIAPEPPKPAAPPAQVHPLPPSAPGGHAPGQGG